MNVGRKKWFLLGVVVAIILAIILTVTITVVTRRGGPEPKTNEIISNEKDTREYRALTLSNKVRVTLVADNTTDYGGMALRIPVGSWANPKNMSGLMHLLEHMLFLGSTRYPGPSDYIKFINDNSGRRNGATGFTYTFYYFKVLNRALRKGVEMLTGFISCPLISADMLDSALNAVDSEYNRNKASNRRTRNQIMYDSALYESALNSFSTGSIQTLNKSDIQDQLWKFYDTYYSANLITVAIIGNETLDTLQDWAEEIFTAIPNKNRKKPEFNTLPFPPGDVRYITRKIYYIPKQDSDTLKIVFPVNVRGYPNLSYITYLMGYEGSGSLFQYLSTRGFITSLSSQLSVEASNFILLGLYSELTTKGLNDIDSIVEAVFKYIRRIREEGINENLWTENKKIDELKFKFQEKKDPASYASSISANMAIRDDPRDYLNPPSRRVYNATLEQIVMEHLRPDNMNLYISSTKLSANKSTHYGPQLTNVEKWYDTPYENTQIEQITINNWNSVELDDDLYLPLENIFRPEEFDIVDTTNATALPMEVNNTKNITLWWYQDNEFKQPKINFGCRIHPVATTPTPKSDILNNMLQRIFQREASAQLYPAVIVGYEMSLGISDFWVLWVSGFSDPSKVKTLIEKSLDIFFDIDFDADEAYFNASIREPIRKNAKNFENSTPLNLCRSMAIMIQDKNVFNYTDTLKILDSITMADVKSMRDRVVSDMAIDCSAMGNVLEEQASNYIDILRTKMITKGKGTIVKEDRLKNFKYPVNKLPNGTYIYRTPVLNPEEPNSGVLVMFQIGPVHSNGPYVTSKPYTRSVMVSILSLLMREPCFNYLRTQKQLGYVATCYHRQYEDIMTYSLLVQGSRMDAGATVMATEIDTFIQMKYDEFTSTKDTAEGQQLWEDIKIALQKQLVEKPISLSEKTARFNKELFENSRDFNRQEKKVEALKELTMDLFLQFYHRYLIADTKRKISSQVYGKGHEVSDTVQEGETLIRDIELFRNTLTDNFDENE